MLEEKRRFRRYKGKEGAFAAFVEPNELVNTGQILDISMGGLCIQYLTTCETPYVGCSALKIFGSGDRFIHLDKVQCRIVYDYQVPECSYKRISNRRCGVEFENLSLRSRFIIEEFIDCFGCTENQDVTPGDLLRV